MCTRKQGLGGLLAAAALGVLWGCGTTRNTPSQHAANPDTWAYHSRRDDPVRAAVPGPVAVDVLSFNGDVAVAADPELTYATVRLRRQAIHGYGEAIEADAAMDDIQYSVEVVPADPLPILKVRTWTENPEPFFLRAHLDIRTPAVGALTVLTEHGDVEVIDIEGPVLIDTSAGDVRVMTNHAMLGAVTVLNRRGDIDYRVRAESTGSFDCEAINGTVDQRSRFGRLVVLPGTRDRRLLATLNDGENRIQLRTVDGDIRVAVVANPTDVGTEIPAP